MLNPVNKHLLTASEEFYRYSCMSFTFLADCSSSLCMEIVLRKKLTCCKFNGVKLYLGFDTQQHFVFC